MSGERAEMEFCAPYYLLLLQVTRYVVEEQKKQRKKAANFIEQQHKGFFSSAKHSTDETLSMGRWFGEKKTTQNTFN